MTDSSACIDIIITECSPYQFLNGIYLFRNGRSEFSPPARGNQWSTGAIGCPEWTGIRIRDLLDYVGIKDDAVYVAYEGKDRHLSGDINKKPISRGVPLWKAMQDESLIVWAMNGEPLPLIHGAPVRMLCPGWPASVSGKWLNRILIRRGVGMGYSQHSGLVIVCDGSQKADERISRVLWNDPASGVMRHADAGYEEAIQCATKHSLNLPMIKK